MTALAGGGGTLPQVSYLISSFNHAAYVRRAIDSVLAQEYPNVELLVCDDCSTDGSRELLTEYAREKGFVLLLNEENRGASHGLNRMIAHARGEYIGLVASDDWIEPRKTAEQVRFLLETGHDAVLAPVKLYHESRDEIETTDLSHLAGVIRDGKYLERLYRTDAGGAMTQSGLFRRAALATLGGFREDYKSDDWLLMIRFMQAGYTVGFMEEAFTVYRLHGSNSHRNAVYCLEQLQLPVIRDFVPEVFRAEALASVYHTCAMKLLETDRRQSLVYEARALRTAVNRENAVVYLKSFIIGLPLVGRLYFSVVRPLRQRVAGGRRA